MQFLLMYNIDAPNSIMATVCKASSINQRLMIRNARPTGPLLSFYFYFFWFLGALRSAVICLIKIINANYLDRPTKIIVGISQFICRCGCFYFVSAKLATIITLLFKGVFFLFSVDTLFQSHIYAAIQRFDIHFYIWANRLSKLVNFGEDSSWTGISSEVFWMLEN